VSDHVLDAVRPAAAPEHPSWSGAAWRQFRLERRMFWRNPSAAFFNFLLPLILLALIGGLASNDQRELDIIVPGIAGLSIMSTTFTALAFNMTQLRETEVLKRIRGTPLPSGSYLAALVASAVTNAAVQIAIITVAGKLIFDVGWPPDWLALVVFTAAGVTCFAALGIAYSHAIPNFESAPAYVNAVFLPVILISGVFFDANRAPKLVRDIAEVLPLKYVVDGLHGAMVTGKGVGDNLTALAVIGAWAVAGIFLAVRGFSWEARRT
jgi:ABC-2 type transport system permease protein